MGIHYFEKIFNPRTIAVIGATDRPGSVGAKVTNNLLEDGFTGEVYPVNPNHKQVHGRDCVPSVEDLEFPIDLAIIITPAETVAEILKQCGKKKIHAALIISAGFAETGQAGLQRQQSLLSIAKQHNIRLIGPNCLGIMRPSLKFNATFSNGDALPGHLALVSQSGAVCASILDWAIEQRIGFSAIASMGNMADVDFGDVLDYLALDPFTHCVLLYIESINNARHFMSGLRAASRLKPVIVIKAGRSGQGARAAISHTGALIGDDDVFDVALHRGGAVRVDRIEQLFDAAEIFSSNYRVKGNRLIIITNGGGAGVMAADRATQLQLSLPELDSQTLIQLNTVLPKSWSHHNPIDILGDATTQRYQETMTICSKDKNIDGILTILVPVAMSNPEKVAIEVINSTKSSHKPIMACWMGQQQVKSSWKLFSDNSLPYFSTPESAVEAFGYLANYYLNQQLALQIPDPLSYQSNPDIGTARSIIELALSQKRNVLTLIESKAILVAFGIPVSETRMAQNAQEAVIIAQSIGFPVVMKILSPDISHKQEVGGVQLNISNAEAIPQLFNQMIERAKNKQPDARILGVTIEKMYKNANDRELMIGMLHDKIFGPVISFGSGGSLVEVMQDRALALPPLNQFIVERLISHTKIAKLLGMFRNMPAANMQAIENILLRVSDMICELPQIREMDINPLIANENETIALDARFVVDYPPTSNIPYGHMAIHPYPRYLASEWKLSDDTPVTIRPIRPEDAKLEEAFIASLSEHSRYLRFFGHLRQLTSEMLIRFTQIDYDREMALIATIQENNQETCIGIARYVTNPDQESCEFAIVVTDNWHNKGIGSHLLTRLMEVAKSKNLKLFIGEVSANNTDMLAMVHNLGFKIQDTDDHRSKIVTIDLSSH